MWTEIFDVRFMHNVCIKIIIKNENLNPHTKKVNIMNQYMYMYTNNI